MSRLDILASLGCPPRPWRDLMAIRLRRVACAESRRRVVDVQRDQFTETLPSWLRRDGHRAEMVPSSLRTRISNSRSLRVGAPEQFRAYSDDAGDIAGWMRVDGSAAAGEECA